MNTSFRFYSRHVFIIGSLFLVFVAIFSYIVDPFSLYGRIYNKGDLEVNGHGFAKHLLMAHPYRVKRQKPEILLMGSSRVAFGFKYDAENNKFASNKVYNLGLLGVTEYELLRYLQHATAVTQLKQVIIGVDFFQFHAGLEPKIEFEEKRLAVDANNQPNPLFTRDYLPTLLSIDSAVESVKEVFDLGKDKDIYLVSGFKLDAFHGGDLSSFKGIERDYVERVYKDFTFEKKEIKTLDYFRDIIEFCYENNIDLRLFISPAHARQWEVINAMGLWSDWELWKRKMVEISEETAMKQHKKPFQLVDFSGYSLYSTEPVPREAGKAVKWYRDTAHFLPSLGDIILDQLFGNVTSEVNCKEQFGILISSKNINEHLQCINQEHGQYVRTHPQDIKDIEALITH